MIDQLLYYRNKLGFPIFPVTFTKEGDKINKKPAVTWAKYQKELPSEDEIKSWSTRFTGWGLATGELSRVVVIDVDLDKLEEAETILGVKLISPIMVKTPSGGTHIYYRWSEELRNTVKIENAPIDFRGDGGLVVIPPSVSPQGTYSWNNPPSDISKALLPELPEEIKKLLSIHRTKVNITLTGSDMFYDGERNAASTVAIRNLLGSIPQEKWGTTGWFAFNHWCKTFCSPALDDVQIKATFDWWVRVNAKAEVSGKSTLEIGIERIEERKQEKDAPRTNYAALDSHIKGWIPGHLYILTGETNSGKSAAACNFAYRTVAQDKKVAYFALEPDVGVIEYLAGIHHDKKWGQITDEDLKLDIPGMTVFTKENKMTLDILIKTIQTMERQDLIIVDHIGYFTNNASDRRSQTQQESDAIKTIVSAAKNKRTAIMVIAHPRKPANSSKNKVVTMSDISGSAAFKQDATDILIIHMDKDPSDPYGLTNLSSGIIMLPKVKTGKSGTVVIKFKEDSPLMLDESEFNQYEFNNIMGTSKPIGIF